MNYELPSGVILEGQDAQYVDQLETDLYQCKQYIDYLEERYRASWSSAYRYITELANKEKDELREKGLS